MHRVTAEMDSIKADGGLKPTTVEDHSKNSWMWNHEVTEPGWGAQRYNQLQVQQTQQVRLWARILVDNPRCFPAVDVAKAQELLDETG